MEIDQEVFIKLSSSEARLIRNFFGRLSHKSIREIIEDEDSADETLVLTSAMYYRLTEVIGHKDDEEDDN